MHYYTRTKTINSKISVDSDIARRICLSWLFSMLYVDDIEYSTRKRQADAVLVYLNGSQRKNLKYYDFNR